MRDFFINAFEKLVAVIVVLMCVFVVVMAVAAAFGGGMGPGGPEGPGLGGGILMGLMVLAFGAIYVVLIGGAMYLGLGIYQNTKRTAELLERLAAK